MNKKLVFHAVYHMVPIRALRYNCHGGAELNLETRTKVGMGR